MKKIIGILINLLRKRKQEPIPFRQSKGDEGAVVIGHYAQELVKNPALDAALKKIEAEIFTAWKISAPKDKEARENLYYRMEGIAQLKLKLAGMVNNYLLEINKKGQAEGQPMEENNG